MAFRVGDKAKVVDKESFLYNKTVEMKKIDNEVYLTGRWQKQSMQRQHAGRNASTIIITDTR